ncbi:uncharacterized protein G2W53_018900 [Senna tora]|uniref:Uncharacterized protein n=1 Tax=Senna tora TaxID=362788 RepID=A0A834WQ83_9FABA|nr:uncharacterized protein G2W53_018900 [Senna tora]
MALDGSHLYYVYVPTSLPPPWAPNLQANT